MLQKRSQHRNIEIITGHNHGKSNPQTVTNKLKRNIVHVGFVARQEDDRLFLLRSLLGNRS